MVGTRVTFSAFYANVTKAVEPVVAYVIKLPIPMSSKKRFDSSCGIIIRRHGVSDMT
jgi:hypothetical protein